VSLKVPLAALLVTLIASTCAMAGSGSEQFQFNHDIRVGPEDNTGDVTCLNCSVYVRGHVSGDIFTLNGNIVVEPEGQIGGDIATLGGDVRLESGTQVGGDIAAIGGTVHRDGAAIVGGDVSALGNRNWAVVIVLLPFLLFAGLVAFIVWLVQRARHPATAPA
jgi:hypothetical protein